MNQKLAEQAIEAISDRTFTSSINSCQKFVRQVIEAVYGDKYERFRDGSAALAARKWNKTGFSHLPNVKLQIGDILYWGASANNIFGHVAIVISETHVAHNSILCRGQKHAYKGVTRISDLRAWQVVVRLPAK